VRSVLRVALLTLLVACRDGDDDRPRPNVVVIVMDTARADRCSFLGYARPTTPRLAEFAKDAVVFEDAWAPCCWTVPSHASLFTGLHVHRHGVHSANRPHLLADATPSMTQLFQAAGWSTGLFSNNDWIAKEYGFDAGFDREERLFDDPKRPYPNAPETHRRALAWAKEARAAKKPFFLFVNDIEPHTPYSPPEGLAERFLRTAPNPDVLASARLFNFPASIGFILGVDPQAKGKVDVMSDLYDAEIASLDDSIGALLDGLEEMGVLDDTIVVVTSDHGENLGEHDRLGHFLSMHRTVLRVPLLVRYPGRFDKGRRVKDLVRLEDVAPTLLDLCGLPELPDADGKPLDDDLPGRVALGRLDAQTEKIPEVRRNYPRADPRALTLTFRSACDGRFHYVRATDEKGGLVEEKLFDVVADPDELRDLVPAGGADLERLRTLLAE
jgi:arylsulfatase A-like enzyme